MKKVFSVIDKLSRVDTADAHSRRKRHRRYRPGRFSSPAKGRPLYRLFGSKRPRRSLGSFFWRPRKGTPSRADSTRSAYAEFQCAAATPLFWTRSATSPRACRSAARPAEKRFTVGRRHEIESPASVSVAATAALEEMIKRAEFRGDLFYRLQRAAHQPAAPA